jgi:hypothetical protein
MVMVLSVLEILLGVYNMKYDYMTRHRTTALANKQSCTVAIAAIIILQKQAWHA